MRTILSLAQSRLRYNKSRTVLTAIAILLTTVLLMGLGTSALGLLDMNRQQAAADGNVHAVFKNLNSEQVAMLSKHMDVSAVEINEAFASIDYGKMNGFLTYGKQVKEGIYHGVGNLIEGHLPEAADDICGPKAFFERMDTDPVLGNQITITFRPYGKGEMVTRTFTICGIVTEVDASNLQVDDSRIAYGATVSDALVQAFVPAAERLYTANLRVNGEEKLNYDEIKESIEKVAADIGCTEENVSLNNEYLYTMTDPGTEMAGIVLGIAGLIIIFSGLVIYSIYYVSVITDVQEIGKLKAIGASDRQIKRMLRTEGMCVSLLAIPPGLLLGYAIPYFFLPIFMNKAVSVSIGAVQIEHLHMFSLPLLLVVAAVVLMTVYISLLKPMRMAAKVSPVEAIRYQESSGRSKMRRGNRKVNVFRLSTANLARNKRRTAVTMLTMGLSCVLFMSLAGVMNSMQAEDIARRQIETGDFRLSLDYSMNDQEYPENNFDFLQQQNIFDESLIENIRSIDGVQEIQRGHTALIGSDYPSEIFLDGRRTTLSPIDKTKAEEYQKEIGRGEIDYEKMIEENGAIFTGNAFWETYGFSIGDTVALTVYDGERLVPFEIKIMASVDDGGASSFVVPQEVFDQLGFQFDTTSDLYISVEAAQYDSVKEALREIADTNEHFRLYSMDEELQIGGASVNMIKYPMYLILLLVAIIGFMNLMNTMIISIVTRKRELGVLQAIGLSDRQLTRMLAGEGLVFTAGTLLASVTLGNLFGYLVFLWAKSLHFMSVSSYHYPVWETAALAVILILGQLLITYVSNRRVRRESLIDRIRSGE